MSGLATPEADPMDQGGLRGLLEDVYRVGREQVESSILAHLLRHSAYRDAFLRACGIPWPAGTHAVSQCEVVLEEGGRADVVVTWNHQGERRLLIEHKIRAPFTAEQPRNYIRHLKDSEVSHAAFMLLAPAEDRKNEAVRRILQSRVLPARSGSTWTEIEQHLRSARRSRWMRFQALPRLTRALAAVEGPPLLRALAEFWRSRHDVVEAAISEPDKARVSDLHARLRIRDAAPCSGVAHFGFHLWSRGEGRPAAVLWLGIEPPVAAQLKVAGDRLLLLQAGYLPPKKELALDSWVHQQGLTWRDVQSGDELSERALALGEENVESALQDLCVRLNVPRTRVPR